jgi:hypothetical protein
VGSRGWRGSPEHALIVIIAAAAAAAIGIAPLIMIISPRSP